MHREMREPPIGRRVPIAGIRISTTSYRRGVEVIRRWAENRESRYVCVCPANGVVTGWLNPKFREILNASDIVTPDGVPVVWTLRMLGVRRQRRVYGPALMLEICHMCERRELPIFLYGSTAQTLADLQANLLRKFPALKIGGSLSPPYRELTDDEERETIREIDQSGARVVFVGLGLPKQEQWMHAHRHRIQAVMIGVGAAFDFHAGSVRQAPPWMRRAGLEWLFRLTMEPRRLWRRYLRDVPIFIMLAIREILFRAVPIGRPNQDPQRE